MKTLSNLPPGVTNSMIEEQAGWNQDIEFFYHNAGYCWNPKEESREEGRIRTANNLACAEDQGRADGLSFHWEIDPDITSANWTDDDEPYQTWICFCHNADGNIIDCVGGVDFGADGTPYIDSYRRVIEAELALNNIF